MSISGRTIAKNVSVMMASQVITWSLGFLLTIFMPRYLGPAVVGQFSLAWSIWLIVATFATFGTDTYLIKEIARRPEQSATLLGTAMVLQFTLYMIGGAAAVIYLSFVETAVPFVLLCVAVACLLNVLSSGITATLQGLEVMEHISVANIVSKLVNTSLTLSLLFLGQGIYAIAAVSLLSAVVFMTILARALRRHSAITMRIDLGEMKNMLRASLPYLMVSLTIVVYLNVDMLVMASMVPAEVMGWYSTTANLFGTLMVVPSVFMTALFPSLSRTYADESDKFSRLAGKSFNLLFMASIPLGLGTVVIARSAVLLLYGPQFEPAASLLALMGIVLIFTYLNTLFGYLMISVDRPYVWSIVMVGGVVATIALDLILIPWAQQTYSNGAIGGGVSYLFVELGMTIVGILLLPRNTFTWNNVRTVVLALISGLVMFAACWWWRDSFLLIPILVGAVVYPAMILLLRAIPAEDMHLIRELGQHLFGRVRSRFGRPVQIGGD